ncbi:MAG: YkgJ family cysteine cluster protein [Dehalococcoidia bacterium]|nr:YkgJ family cysteine cluster protein [Dehalococcoidia bacterium]
MSTEKSVIKTMEGQEFTVSEQAPIPCLRCGTCCNRYQPPLGSKDIESIASALGISNSECVSRYALKAPIKEGYLLKRTDKGCIFLAFDADGRARCAVHPSQPQACRDWTPSLSKPECREGLARVKSRGHIVLPEELFRSEEERAKLLLSLEEAPPQT